MSNINNIDPKTAADWIDSGDAVLIDVREAGEHAAERIANAELLPLSAFRNASLFTVRAASVQRRPLVSCKSAGTRMCTIWKVASWVGNVPVSRPFPERA